MATFERELVYFNGAECVEHTAKAIKVAVGRGDARREVWIPQSQVADSSEVYGSAPYACKGRLVVSLWIAEQKNITGLAAK